MKEFLKKNKFVILFFTILIIIMCSVYSRTFAYTYETLEFKYGKVTTECLNIRCGPGVNYNRVGKLHKDEYIDVFAKVGEWYIIQTDNNVIGAVSSNYIEAVYDENERYSAVKGKKEEVNQNEVIKTEENSTEDKLSDELNTSFKLSDSEQEFINLINSNRKNNGLSELQIDEQIENIARIKARDLEENNYFSHTSPTYGNIDNMFATFNLSYKSSAENIAGNKNLAGAVEAWMNSENHKSNILNEQYKYTGVAIIDSKKYGKIFVQVFADK